MQLQSVTTKYWINKENDMTTLKMLFAAVALMISALFGLNAQPKLTDQAVVTEVPRLTNIPVCINMTGPMLEKVRKEVYNLGARQITVGAGACADKISALGFFFSQPKKLGEVQESGPGFSNYGTPWLVDAFVVVVKNGEMLNEVARAGSARLAGQVNSGGLYKNTSPGEAISYSEQTAVKRLFKKGVWHIGAAEVLRREFGPKMPETERVTENAPAVNISNQIDALNAKALDLSAQAKQIETDAKAAKLAARTKAEAEKRLKKAQAELDKAKKEAAKK
jgi:hypothetical protein